MIIHGNQLLGFVDSTYGRAERVRRYGEPSHTLEAIFSVFDYFDCRPPESFTASEPQIDVIGAFAGYILLDALIGNTDRHHQNWAVTVAPGEDRFCLAATFDHASCLGRDLPEEEIVKRLATRDAGFSPEAYAERARSALFRPSETEKSMTTLEAFERVQRLHSKHGAVWLNRVENISEKEFGDILTAVPESRMPVAAKKFALRTMMHNRNRLLKLREEK